MEDKKKAKFPRINSPASETFMPPETTGAMKRDNPFHWSIDELIEYKSTGVRPKMIIDETYIYKLARLGVSIKNICHLFGISEETFCNNTAFLSTHQEGRANLATANRAAIVAHAANGSLDAQKYLDKLIGGDVEVQTVNMSVTARPLEQIPTENLLDVVFKEDENNKG